MPKLKPLVGRGVREKSKIALDRRDPVGFWTWDAQRDRIWADTVVAQLLSLDPEEAEAGLPLSIFTGQVHPPDRARLLASFRSQGEGDGSAGLEYRVRAADGGLRLVLSHGRFAYDHLGRALSGHGIIVDISDLEAHDAGPAPAGLAEEEPTASLVDQAAAAAIVAFQAVAALNDPGLTVRAEALLFEIGRKLATQEAAEERKRMN